MPITTHSPTTTTLKTVSDLRHPQMPLSALSSTAVKKYPIYQPQAIRPPSSLPEAPNHWVVPHGERSSGKFLHNYWSGSCLIVFLGDGPTQTRILHSVLAKPRSLLKSREAEIGQHCLQKVIAVVAKAPWMRQLILKLNLSKMQLQCASCPIDYLTLSIVEGKSKTYEVRMPTRPIIRIEYQPTERSSFGCFIGNDVSTNICHTN